ncbi:hypothetical protein F5Y16DRAFT_100075 [Xylariaceae sp. FL0255]|nr:hypothetical protein F5Y16DRAFT_100075 [Xylariaceae sp. FL0255]
MLEELNKALNSVGQTNDELGPFVVSGATIDWKDFPRARDDHRIRHRIVHEIRTMSQTLGRPLTATEANATAEHVTAGARYIDWSTRVSCVLGCAIAIATRRRTFPFPGLRTPHLNKAYMPFGRSVIFTLFLSLPVQAFFANLQMSTTAARMRTDTRLKPLIEEAQARRAQIVREALSGRSENPRSPPQPQQEQAPQNWGAWSQATSSPQSAPPQQPREAPSQGWGDWPQTASSPRPTSPQPAPTYSSPNQPDEDDPFDEDDGSPVSRSVRRAEASQASSSSGSSWDRIRQKGRAEANQKRNDPSSTASTWEQLRQEAKSESAMWSKGDSSGEESGWAQLRQDKTGVSRESAPKTDGFAYTKEVEEREKRNYEKEQAQKDFDALVEAERQGGNGASASRGNTGRWR